MAVVSAALSFNTNDWKDNPSSRLTAAEISQLCIPPLMYEDESRFPGGSKTIHMDFGSDNCATTWMLGAWDGFMDEVLHFSEELPTTGSFYFEPETDGTPVSDEHGLSTDLKGRLECLGRHMSTATQSVVGWPDVCVEWENRNALLIGVVELDTLPAFSPSRIRADLASSSTSPFWPVLNRLREMLALSRGVRYSFVTTRKTYWFCYGNESMLVLSPPVDAGSVTLACFWYLMALSELKRDMVVKALWTVARTVDFPSVRETMKTMVKQLQVPGSEELKLKFWSRGEFELGRMLSKRNCDVLCATKNDDGEEVVLKIRDLGSHRSVMRDEMRKFVREVVAYKRLRRIQGRAIPFLRSYGFMSGGMFAVLVLSYAGEPRDFAIPDNAAALRYGEEAARVLARIHHRGLLHGDLETNSVMVRSEEPLQMTIVGLSQAKPSSTAKDFAREIIRIKAGCGMTVEEARKRQQVPDIDDYETADDDGTGDDSWL